MNEIMKSEPWISTKEIAEHMDVTVETVRKWIKFEKSFVYASIRYGNLKLVRSTRGDKWTDDQVIIDIEKRLIYESQ